MQLASIYRRQILVIDDHTIQANANQPQKCVIENGGNYEYTDEIMSDESPWIRK
jgi:hypothetical protein